MNRTPKNRRRDWSGLTALALLGAVFALGVVANWVSLAHALAAVGAFGAAVGMAWLWQRTVREAEEAERLPEADDEPGKPR